jgi:septal ring-binding cell division protein DamX
MPILQVSPQLPSSLQISQSAGVIIAIVLAVLIIIIAVALVLRTRRRSSMLQGTESVGSQEMPDKGSFEEIAVADTYRETTTQIPFSGESPPEATYPATSDVGQKATESVDYSALHLPQETTTIIKGNVNVAAVTATSRQAAEIHTELTSLSYNEAITPSEAVIDDQGLNAKISEVKDDLDSNEILSVILLKCVDIARSLSRRTDLQWIRRELFGSPEWDDAVYLDVTNEDIFPAYRLINAAMYLNYTREGDTYLTIEEYAIPVFENRSIYALEKILEAANIQNQDYVILNTPAPAQWPSTASLGELIPLTVSVKDYMDLLAEVKNQAREFINSL